MKTTDLFTNNRSAKRLNESLAKTFGQKLNLESFSIEQLEDARNKLRTQIYTARSGSNFNETVENETLSKAQFMHDAIVAELMDRNEPIVDTTQFEASDSLEDEVAQLLKRFDEDMNEIGGYGMPDENKIVALLRQGDIEGALDYVYGSYADQDGGELRDMDRYIEGLKDEFEELAQGGDDNSKDEFGTFKQGESLQNEAYINNAEDAINLLADLRKQSKMAELGQGEPVRPNQLVNDLYDVMQWIENNMKESIETESKNTGEDMRNLREGEIQQASAIVTAKTMVDRVGRWIEELSGMENDTLLQLGDSIRDEMGQEQAKQFISASAPAIQSALENLKATREALASSVRALTGEEQSAEMLGGEPGADMAAPAEPDAMNAEPGMDMGDEVAGDDFDAAEPAAGGLGDAGREQRESIDRQSRLMKVLAG
jgi:hypothetical protein